MKTNINTIGVRLPMAMLTACIWLLFQSAQAAPPQWNVVVILADDLGWKDLSSYGSDFYRTPHIDKLSRDGMKFTQAYSACTVCSPTRAALMTGKYPARVRVTDWIPGQMPENPKLIVPDFTKYLSLEEASLARVFKKAGYATASIGKWHLGGEEYYPEKHGFDINIAGTHSPGVATYFAPYKTATLPDGPDGEYVTDRLGEEAVRWLDANKDKPFFLYLPHFAVHTPIQAKRDLIEKYRAQKQPGQMQTNEVYAAMLESLDDAVGRVRNKINELGLADRTVILFGSDNGGRITQGTTSNLPLRAGKGGCYEGGTRVPFIVYWPGVTRPGSVSDTPTITMDIYPTVLEIAGMKKEACKGVDGLSLVPLLRGTGKQKRDELFWHYPHYQHYQLGGTTPYGAIRKGDLKLIEYFDDMRVELYNLKDDIGERNNLAASMPKKADELRKRLHAWRKEVAAQMPTRNPDYDPSRPEHDPATRKKPAKK
jgi:arylsulfatase A-like enzyme